MGRGHFQAILGYDRGWVFWEVDVRVSTLSMSLPVAMGYVPLGMVFGFLFVQAGGAWYLALAASLVVYAGASQFAMIPMLAAGLPVASLALAALVINLRHAFYGLSLLNDQPKNPLARLYFIFALTDETYSLVTTLTPRPTPNQMALLAGVNQCWWVFGTLLGAWLGAQLPVSLVGLEFALAALFGVLAVEQWRATRALLPLVIAPVSYVITLWWWPEQALLLAMAICLVASIIGSPRVSRGAA
ncbi:MAG: AzlC family ABC transporter permease [Burkholderiaceae bacterium]|nr:AzlC family ABC transporter permease [Burkholderiaceae bacterium]MCD8536889.1 AzlC family ABC transporter permease [Burkholderiaceae bacterium]MCD8566084.1 AzlC family ABC transporter permease [Burkholderiaceae bacterium]